MIEVAVELLGCGVYFPGEQVTCTVAFTNHGGSSETIAWAGAQLHCQYCCREDVVSVDPSHLPPRSPGTDTAFIPNRGERGHSLLSTSTTVLLCNLSLQPGDSRSVVYSELIPSGGPPTLSGRLVKYTYKLAVGAQKPGCLARIIRVPFRVRVIPAHLCSNQAVPSPADTNPFLRAEVSEDPTFDLALQALAAETSRRSAMSYTLKVVQGVLGRLTFFKPSYKLGEDVNATFDLSMATISCLQVKAVLQCSEQVAPSCLKAGAPVSSSVSSHSQVSECCHNTLLTHLALPIPLTVTQSFCNSTVEVKWQVLFEFVVSSALAPEKLLQSAPGSGISGSEATVWKGVEQVAMDTMTWTLPITVLPTLPSHSDVIQRTTHTLTI